MTGKNTQMGIVLLVVTIVVVAAVAVAIPMKTDAKSNPNNILGMYEIVDYTQYGGVGSSNNWQYYETGCGAYEGEKIRIDSYDNGTVRATCMLGGEEYKIIGYYDPETLEFGYTSYYDYVPEEGAQKTKVIDWLQGAIIGDTMYLRGYTMSAEKVANPMIYTFNFTFVKEGKTVDLMPMDQALFKGVPMESTETWAMVGTQETNNYPYRLALKMDEYHNGVYKLTETTTNINTGEVVDAKMTASTIYQDSQRTILRAIGYYGPNDYNICWYVIEGKHMYCLFNSNAFEIKNVSCRTLYTSDGSTPTFYEPYDLSGKIYSGSVTQDSSDYPTSTLDESFYIVTQGKNTNVAVTTGLQINVIPGLNALAYFSNDEYGGVSYYGDMMGQILPNGNVLVYGFVYGSDGEALYVHGTLTATAK